MSATKYKIDKDTILDLTDGGFLFYKFVIPDLEKYGNSCENTYNPFYDDRNPSFSIYYSDKQERWMFKDHGTPPNHEDYYGDVFDFAKHYYLLDGYTLSFSEMLYKMAEDLGILSNSSVEYPTSLDLEADDSSHSARWRGLDLLWREDESCIEDALKYFSQYGITKEVLLRYRVRSVKKYLYIDKEGKLIKKFCNQHLVIAYETLHFAKLYSPSPKKFWFVGKKEKDYIFGYDELLMRNHRTRCYQSETLIITGGEKDVLTLASLGYDAVCFNSETASIPEPATDILFHWYKRIVVMYDLDETGRIQSKKLIEKCATHVNISEVVLPAVLLQKGGKDVSDYVKLGLDINQLKLAIENSGCYEKVIESAPASDSLIECDSQIAKTFSHLPSLPEAIFNKLPKVLKKQCDLFTDPIDKDLVLLSALGVTSSLFPKVKGVYDGRKVGLNFYLFVSAPASSGKGIMMWGREFGTAIQKHLQSKFLSEIKLYELRVKDFKAGAISEKPVAPVRQSLFIPANTSTSKMIDFLNANKNFGIIFQTEADTLANALKNDWGNFSEVLRCAFHHENVTLARKIKDEFIEIDSPHLSVVLSGTPDQVTRLLESVENGFFSRFLFYDFKAPVVWKNQFGNQSTVVEEAFKSASQEMLSLWELQYDSDECTAYLTEDQIEQLNNYFSRTIFSFYVTHGDAIVASIKRSCLVCYRIAMILTVLRQCETNGKLQKEMWVAQGDVDIALDIVNTLLNHLQKVFERLESSSTTSKLNSQQRALYYNLPDEFTRKEYDEIAAESAIKYKTAERYLSVYKKHQLMENFEHSKYRKC